MGTFKEIAERAGQLGLGALPGYENNPPSMVVSTAQREVGLLIAELAQAMHRLERNLAFQLAMMNASVIDEVTRNILVESWLQNLRAELPPS